MYYIFVENNEINGCGQCECLNEEIQNIEIPESVYYDFIEEPLKYKYEDGQIVENPEFQSLKHKEEISKQILEIQEKLDILDAKRIRAVCEDEIRDEKTGETWLDYYNSQIYDLRIELKSLETQL